MNSFDKFCYIKIDLSQNNFSIAIPLFLETSLPYSLLVVKCHLSIPVDNSLYTTNDNYIINFVNFLNAVILDLNFQCAKQYLVVMS